MSARRLWNVFRRNGMNDDLREEIETHLTLIEEEECARGASADDARRIARSRFGSPVLYRERALDVSSRPRLRMRGAICDTRSGHCSARRDSRRRRF